MSSPCKVKNLTPSFSTRLASPSNKNIKNIHLAFDFIPVIV